MKPLVSIVVPFYTGKSEKFTKCIDSILNQTYKNIELILVSDGGDESLIETAKIYADIHENCKLVLKENGGSSSARNFGINQSSGQLITFVDSDDYLDTSFIENLVETRKSQRKNALIGGKIRFLAQGTEKYEQQSRLNCDSLQLANKILNEEIHGSACRYLFDANILKKIHFNETIGYMEDALFLITYCKIAKIQEIELVPTFYNYVYEGKSETHSQDSDRALNDIFKAIDAMKKIEPIKDELINDCKIRFLESKLKSCEKKWRIIIPKYKNRIELKYRGPKIKYKLFIMALKQSNSIKPLNLYYLAQTNAKRILSIIHPHDKLNPSKNAKFS